MCRGLSSRRRAQPQSLPTIACRLPSVTAAQKRRRVRKNAAGKPKLIESLERPMTKRNKPALMLLLLTSVLTACSNKSPDYSPAVAPPAVPSLPKEARQPETPPYCLPTCSAGWSRQVESWQKRLTGEADQGEPASNL